MASGADPSRTANGEARTVRLGFVGAGFMGQQAHLRSYTVIPDCRVVALAEGRPELAKTVAARYGIERIYPDHAAMLEAEDLDGVIASVPFSQHASLAPQLYEGCRHLFTEKPLALGPETGRALAAASRAAGCVHMVGYHKRADPAVTWGVARLRRWRETGEAGKLRYVRVVMPAGDWVAGGRRGFIPSSETPSALAAEAPPAELDASTAAAYVSFVNYYIHQVNLLRLFLGEGYEVRHADPSGVVLVAESHSGVPAVLEMSPYRTATAWEEEVLVAFEHGYIRVGLAPPLARNQPGWVEALLDRPGGSALRERPVLPWTDAMLAEANHFVRVCRDEAAPLSSIEDAAEDLAVAYDYVTQHSLASRTEAGAARPRS